MLTVPVISLVFPLVLASTEKIYQEFATVFDKIYKHPKGLSNLVRYVSSFQPTSPYLIKVMQHFVVFVIFCAKFGQTPQFTVQISVLAVVFDIKFAKLLGQNEPAI